MASNDLPFEKRKLEDHSTSSSDVVGLGAVDYKKRRQRLTCKGSFKSQPSRGKLYKDGGQPIPGILDFPSKITLSKTSLMRGIFIREAQLIRLTSPILGKLATHMGFTKPGGIQYLHPEEALFLVETGRLLISQDADPQCFSEPEVVSNVICSVQAAYSCLLTDLVSLPRYIVYAHLARTGYKVLIATDGSKNRIYNAYEPTSDFAKTRPPPPKFRVLSVYLWSQSFPSLPELAKLRDSAAGDTNKSVPLKIALVAPDGDVSFFTINCPE